MIFRSPYDDVGFPEMPLTEFVFRRASEHAAKPALIDGVTGRTLTYAQLTRDIRRTAAGLHARGFRQGDVFALFSPNLPEYAVAFHAVAMLGGVNTTLNPLSTADEVAAQLTDARAKYLVTVPQLLDKASDAARRAGVEQVFVFGQTEGETEGKADGESESAALPFDSLMRDGAGDADDAAASAALPDVRIDVREDLVALPYSSGTTGKCKGVMLTHRNMVANLCQIEGTRHAMGDDTLICVLPLFHIYGMTVIMNFGLYAGATIVTLPRFEPELLLQTLQNYRVTMAHFVPPLILMLAKHPSVADYDLSSLKSIFSAAAPLGAQVAREASARLACPIKQGYGMTEASPATHMPPVDAARVKAGSVGQLVPNTECKIVDTATGAVLGTREEGEILIRGPQVMKGYLNCAEATAQTVDAEGWLHTGDIGYADEDGSFYIVDRAKELIKYKGYQVAPAELEAVLLSHASVADAAVVPSPDDEAGEIPKAFVVRRDDVAPDALIAFVAARVAPHKKIRRLEFIEQIPKSPSGKILRRLLVAREREKGNDGR